MFFVGKSQENRFGQHVFLTFSAVWDAQHNNRDLLMQSRNEILEAFAVDDAACSAMNQIWKVVEPHVDQIVDDFYKELDKSKYLNRFQDDKKWRAHARARQIDHLKLLFSGRFDEEYFTSVAAVGAVHFRIQLPFLHYTAAYRTIAASIQTLIFKNFKNRLGKPKRMEYLSRVAQKAFYLDIQAATQAYMEAANREREQALSAVSTALADLGAGQIDRRIMSSNAHPFPEKFDNIRLAFNALGEKMAAVFGDIYSSAETVSANASEMSGTSNDLAQRTQSQAASVEEASRSVRQILESVDTTEKLVDRLSKRSSENSSAAQKGSDVIGEARLTMHKIQDASREINSIVDVIDDISFQTNLLALNAGVEAARAGEAGKGFAVVASEVRGLAQRSAESASSIRSLIAKSNQIVQNGSELMDASSESLERILSNASEVASGVEDIRIAATEQASSLREIGSAISTIEGSTNDNAAAAEIVNDTCRSLKSEADSLGGQFASFASKGRDGASPSSSMLAAE